METGAPGHPPSLRGSWPLLTRLALAVVDLSLDPPTLLKRGLQGGRALPRAQGCRPVPAHFRGPQGLSSSPIWDGPQPASVSTHSRGQAQKRAPGAGGPSQASMRGGTGSRRADPRQLSTALPLLVRVGVKAPEKLLREGPLVCPLLSGKTSGFPVPCLPLSGHTPQAGGAGPRCPSPMGTTRTRHCLRSHHPRGWRGVPWGLVPRVTVGGPGAALTQPCPSLHHLPPGPPLGNAGDSLVLRLSCLSETPVSWNAQRVSWTVLDFLVVSSPTFVIILFCSLLSLLHCLCLSYLRLPLCYHTLISKNSLLLRCFVNTTSLPLSELA